MKSSNAKIKNANLHKKIQKKVKKVKKVYQVSSLCYNNPLKRNFYVKRKRIY